MTTLRLSLCIIPVAFILSSVSSSSVAKLVTRASKGEIQIAQQIWMVSNLDVDKFRNGDPIPQVKSKKQWRKAGESGQPAWCYYGMDPGMGAKYGKLYNWHAVNDQRGLAPDGWHIPSQEEWELLVQSLGGKGTAGYTMKSDKDWLSNGNGTNSSGFNGLPAGLRNADGFFGFYGEYAKWWTSTNGDTRNAWCHYLCHGSKLAVKYYISKSYGLSVRCVKD